MGNRKRRLVMVVSLVALLAGLASPVWGAPETNPQSTVSQIHIVQWGENLTLIARRYGVSTTAIAQANGIANPNYIYAGQRLVIPTGSTSPAPPPSGSTTTYVVRRGDTLSGIAYRFGTTVNGLVSLNGLVNPNLIFAGQTLRVPGQGAPSQPSQPAQTCVYVVKRGDNLTRIALAYRTTVWAIAIANNLANPSFIWVGQRLTIPGCSPSSSPTPTPRPTTPAPGPTVSPTPTAKPGPAPGTKTPEYGVHTFMWWNGEHRDRDAQLAKDAGVTWVKEVFPWKNIEGAGKGIFDWSVADQLVQILNDRGLKIIARVDFQPIWARADGANNGPPDNYIDYGDFLYAMASRYRGKIHAYEIWNEPNLAREWGGKAPNAAEYVALLRVAHRGIKQADPNAVVMTAGLAPTGTGLPHAIPDAQYLREMYQAGAKNYFDVLGVHAPGYKAAPETDPAEVANNPALGGRRFFCFRRVEDLRQIMVQNGDAGKQMAVLEFGWTSDPRPGSPYQWHAVSEETKADYIVRAFQWARDHWSPWMGPMTVLSIADVKWTEADEQYWWAITNPDGTTRPAYDALRNAPK
ncbi:MAG: LysM peptidoglycan-binding domain-containing protein [Anaerolineae bacterium]|nr:LysM peptidoglycan-binding domain-containing protein [Anaerolineae bacterium]NIN98278.1 LysM peptidoglycan-binding domain-containing protein [Anaerolineae bacterium]NIQ81207.1 LysM peptidoglycan-binding domain-containing protein [Anaerolineae bacterium]